MNTHQVQIGTQLFTFKVTIEKDDDHGAPWENEDGHGDVTGWETRNKRAGELILNSDRGSRRYYDFAGACQKALAEGWDDTPSKIEGEPETKRQKAARAARADFEHLQAWCNDEWQYEFITVTLLDRDGNPTTHTDSIGGTDSDYAPEQARLMCDELASQVDASGPTSEELNLLPLPRIDYLHNELRAIHESETDDDSDFDAWVSQQASTPGAQDGATCLEYLRLSHAEERARGLVTAQVNGPELRYCVDGAVTENDPDGPELQGDGAYPPFVVFDIQEQENLPGHYPTRQDAEAALAAAIAQGEQTTALVGGFLAVAKLAHPDGREATQRFAILNALTGFCGLTLTADRIDALVDTLAAEMSTGATSWAFKPGDKPAPVLGFDGFGLNDIADEYRSRVFTLATEYKPGHQKADQGAAFLSTLEASGLITRNY